MLCNLKRVGISVSESLSASLLRGASIATLLQDFVSSTPLFIPERTISSVRLVSEAASTSVGHLELPSFVLSLLTVAMIQIGPRDRRPHFQMHIGDAAMYFEKKEAWERHFRLLVVSVHLGR